MIREVDLQSYLPPYLQELKEIAVTLQAEDAEFILAWKAADRILKNQFFDTMDEMGLRHWEHILHILPKRSDTLEERIFRVKTKINQGKLPYTMRTLKRYLKSISSDYTAWVDTDAYALHIKIQLDGYPQRDMLMNTLENMVPANMILTMQTWIPQKISQPQTIVAAAQRTMVVHQHKEVTGFYGKL